MTQPISPPITDPDGVRWIGGAWFGSQIGGTAWMLTAFASYAWQAPWLGFLFLAAFIGINSLGVWIWRHRSRFLFFRSVQLMTLVCVGLALLALIAFDFFPSENLKHNLIWQRGRPRWECANHSEFRSAYFLLFVMVPALLILFEVQGRQARRRERDRLTGGVNVSDRCFEGAK